MPARAFILTGCRAPTSLDLFFRPLNDARPGVVFLRPLGRLVPYPMTDRLGSGVARLVRSDVAVPVVAESVSAHLHVWKEKVVVFKFQKS